MATLTKGASWILKERKNISHVKMSGNFFLIYWLSASPQFHLISNYDVVQDSGHAKATKD